MRSLTIQCITLAVVGLAKAQTCPCSKIIVDFEGLTDVTSLGPNAGRPIPNGYADLDWLNAYGATPNAASPVLPQGNKLAAAITSPANTPIVISTTGGRTISPKSIFVCTTLRNPVGIAGAAPLASVVTIVARFQDSTTAQFTYSFEPTTINTIAGLSAVPVAMQNAQLPCDWTNVVSLSFTAQPKNALPVGGSMSLQLDNLEYTNCTTSSAPF